MSLKNASFSSWTAVQVIFTDVFTQTKPCCSGKRMNGFLYKKTDKTRFQLCPEAQNISGIIRQFIIIVAGGTKNPFLSVPVYIRVMSHGLSALTFQYVAVSRCHNHGEWKEQNAVYADSQVHRRKNETKLVQNPER